MPHIQGFSELLQERIAASPDEMDLGHLKGVIQACRKMSDLIEDMLPSRAWPAPN